MDIDGEGGVFLTLNDCKALFPRLKGIEHSLSKDERMIMYQMEKVLYRYLSIQEMEELLEGTDPQQADTSEGRRVKKILSLKTFIPGESDA